MRHAFDIVVQHFTPSGVGGEGWVSLKELLRNSDIASLHSPLNASTRHLIDVDSLDRMKPSAILLNVSRGPVARIADVTAGLQSGHLDGAGLDVLGFEPEVPAALVAMPNVVLSLHSGVCTAENRSCAWIICFDNALLVLQGAPPKTPVFRL